MDTFYILHQLIHLFKSKEERQSERTGLSGREMYILEHIREENPWRFNDFAANYHIKPSTLTGIVERLEKKDLLRRDRDPNDRKAVYLKTTPPGRKMIEQHVAEDKAFFSSFLSPLTPEEQEQFLTLVIKLTQAKNR